MFIAASGHFGQQSPTLVKHYAEDLGFDYLSASTKPECEALLPRFLAPAISDRPMIFEVFTRSNDESLALKTFQCIEENKKGQVKNIVRKLVGQKGIDVLKKALRS